MYASARMSMVSGGWLSYGRIRQSKASLSHGLCGLRGATGMHAIPPQRGYVNAVYWNANAQEQQT
jgi:hypothetical protein